MHDVGGLDLGAQKRRRRDLGHRHLRRARLVDDRRRRLPQGHRPVLELRQRSRQRDQGTARTTGAERRDHVQDPHGAAPCRTRRAALMVSNMRVTFPL